MKTEQTNPNSSHTVPVAPTSTADLEGSSSPVVNYVEELYERAHDAREGYQKAAELTDSPDLKAVFEENSAQRTGFALELEGHLRTMGEDPNPNASFYGKLHQGWMHIVAKFSDGEEALLSECQRGEEAALESYQDALDALELPQPVAETVERQRDRVKRELVTLRNLEQLETAKS